ncbi:unnamed protein product [Chilo suppressalis]|uniref:Cysteine proteinase n=1 Tax=Chilo suppressalis TaxID=168631 RepID=A0ABN8L2Q8_CHISP|nr:unnamed protein product [Chilo suppressalis]
MGRHIVLISLLIVFIINYCVCELSVEKKQKIYNGFVSYLKNLPDQPYYLHNGILKNIVETSENGYSIEVDFRGEDTDAQDLKFVKCYGTVYDKQESGVEVANGYQCHVESDTSTPADSIEEVVTEWLTTEPPELHQPIKLDNEVQTEPVTSGEQFIAVPRDGQPCIGCASQVNPEAAGVTDLALLGIRQLDQLEPSVIHSLNKVIMVERQVQVVNGVRYILTILIDYNSCSQNVAEECVVTKTCKVSVLDKPWAKLPDGSRYRVVVANNCTADWIFEEIGETRDSERDKPQNPQLPTPHYGEVPNIGTFEDIIHSVRNPDVQSQPEIEKSLTDEEIRNIQQQIIPNSQFSQQSLEKQQLETNNVHGNDLRAHQVVNTESQSSFVHSNPTNNLGKISHGRNGISDEKKKVIDDLLNFFDYAGFKQKNDGDKEASRMKRSFEKELHTFDLAENFNKMRKNIDSAKHIYALAQSMVDYLNEMDMSIKNRLLSSVISAEEESENNHRYFYVQARIIIPCDKVECNNKDEQIKICNGVIDGTNERSPQVMNTFCHNEKGKKNNIGKNNIVPPGDPILSKLAYTALKTIELESQEDNALYIIKIHNANTQKLSGTLTKIAILLGHTNCSKSVGLYKRKNCTKVEKMGTKLCDVEILEKGKEKKISYICTDRPVGESFVNKKLKYGIDDPDVDEILEEALQYLEIQSNKNNKQRVVDVKSVSTRLVGGLLTNIEFLVGYTKCTNNNDIGRDYCEFLKNETFRNCEAQIWQRPWLEDERQMKVLCEDDISNPVTENGNDFRIRKRRQVASQPLFGGLTKQDKNDPRYKAMAEESLQKYLQTSGATGPHRVVTIDNVKSQVVAGSLTTIDFTVLANNADVIKCHSKIWEQPWINKKEIDVTCALANEQNRGKRQVPGGEKQQDKNDPRYKAMAEECLQKYLQTSGATGPHRIVTIDNVKSQVVVGSLTTIDFTVLANNADVIKCHSKIWEQPWINKKEIDVTCANEQNRVKRQLHEEISGGFFLQDPQSPEYTKLAEKSLLIFLNTSNVMQHYKVTKVTKVQTQVVSGFITKLVFLVSPTNCQITEDGKMSASSCDIQDSTVVKKCNSKVWDKPWRSSTVYSVKCFLNEDRQRREILRKRFKTSNYKMSSAHSKVGSTVEQDPSKNEYKILADESLRKYQLLQKSNIRQKILQVKRVETQVVSGTIYKIEYTAVPTTCSANVIDTSSCDRTDDKVILYCHTEIWDRPWLKRKNIDVSCIANKLDEDEKDAIISKRSVLGGPTSKDVDNELYKKMAKTALEKYQKLTKTEYLHKVLTITHVSEKVIQGFLTTIKFTISPTTCLLKSATDEEEDCPFQQPIAKLMCVAEIRERPVLDLTDEDITVTCHRKKHKNIKQISKRISKYDRNHDTREKRQTRTDENEIGDDAKYVYAHHAIKNINQRSDTDNLQKLITIYDVVTTYQMETPMVSMYIETAYTYCLKQNKDIDLNSCDELDGMNHRICFVRVFPSADDDLVVLKVVTVCDDEPNFVSVTHLSVPDLLTISLVALENSPDIGYKLVHRGEPYVVPSLHSHIPVKLSFIVASTNCSKYVKVATDVNVRCFVDTTIPDKECHANIWMMPVTKKILHISANCSRPHLTRTKRTLTSENTTANIQDMVDQSLEKLEMSSLHRYKQRVIKINSYSTKLTSGRVTTIDFDVGYTNCLKYEWVDDASTCQFIEHLPRRHCVSEVWERLWLKNGRKIEVTCQDDETPLEAHVEFESADIATRLAQQALKHIEAKYPHPKKQQLVRIFSLEKQVVAGIHYRMKIEVGLTDCLALSVQDNCHLINDGTPNRFCRVNVWLRPWTDHPPNFRVTCDYQAGAMTDMYHHVQAEQLFFNFITTYKPEYINDHVEMTKRFEIFKENVKKIHELNTHERGTGVYAVTRFTDLTYEEFKSKYLGLNPNLKKPNQIPMRQAEIPKVHQLPASFDWRPLGAVTEVKDQGACGSCWAFSVTGNIEGQWKLKTGKLLSLSEQELVDCDKMDDGCDGGYMDNAYRAIEQLGGLETEEEYPYEAEDDKCSFNKSLSKVQISGAVNISSNETNMAKWLVHNGPISIGINANAMQFYVGGVSHPWKALCNPKNIDHGVLIVGYGIKEYPLFNKQLPYWVVKNSWGPGWGEQGYYRVFRGDGTCGVNTMASSAVV